MCVLLLPMIGLADSVWRGGLDGGTEPGLGCALVEGGGCSDWDR